MDAETRRRIKQEIDRRKREGLRHAGRPARRKQYRTCPAVLGMFSPRRGEACGARVRDEGSIYCGIHKRYLEASDEALPAVHVRDRGSTDAAGRLEAGLEAGTGEDELAA